METFIAILAIVLGIVGIVGSVAPGLPGPPLSWLGMLALYIWGNGTNGTGEPLSTTLLLVWLGIVIVVSILAGRCSISTAVTAAVTPCITTWV